MRVRFLLTTLGLVLVGIGLLLLRDLIYTSQNWLDALGHAILIAGVLGLTVDPYLKAKLTSETFDSTLRAALGKDLPPPLHDELRRIGSCNFVREHFEATFEIREESDNQVTLSTVTNFDVRNISSEDAVFDH